MYICIYVYIYIYDALRYLIVRWNCCLKMRFKRKKLH